MGKKILIIDDNKLSSTLVKDALVAAGFEASVANDGKEGIEKLRSEEFNLVILDLILPGLDGFGVLTIIKNDPHTKNIPVLVLTYRDSQEERDEVMRLGAKDYFVKYKFSYTELVKYLKSTLF